MKNININAIKETLSRGVEIIYPNPKELEKVLLSGKKLKLYCGYDPTTPSLHLGHLVTLLKLSQFQKLGHEVVMLIGDFTATIGDPTDKTSTRKRLTIKEVISNAKNYKKIASKVLNFKGSNPAKTKHNNDWLGKLTFINLIELSANFTVQQMIVRDMFQERLKRKKPIYLHEFLYPLAQAYDSVVLNVDLEVGGKDQIFNMLCGRDLLKTLKNKEKFILGTKLLIDPTTGRKISKTEGTVVAIDEPPKEIYGKIMSWPDDLISVGFELCTKISFDKLKKIEKSLKEGQANPMEMKSLLAKEIVSLCCNKKEAKKAEEEFKRVFQKKQLPSKISKVEIKEKELPILDLLIKAKLFNSRSEAKRVILQKGVKISGITESDWQKTITIKKGTVIKVGKRKFVEII